MYLVPQKPPELLFHWLSILKETKARVYSMTQKHASQHVPNITELKRLEAALQASENQYRTLSEEHDGRTHHH